MTEKTIKNTDLDETNSINSDDEKGVDSIKDLLSGINKVIDKSNKSNKSNKSDKSKKSKKKKEVVIEEDDSDDDSDDDTDDSDEKTDNIELDEEDSDNEDSEESSDDDEEDCCDDDMFDTSGMTLAALFQETFYSSEGESVADIFAGIRDELHKMNHNMKKYYKK